MATSATIGRDTQFGTYRQAGLPWVDFGAFHEETLPARLASGRSAEIAWDVAGRAPISIGLPDGRFYTYRHRADEVVVEAGKAADAATILEIVDHESWLDYLYEYRTRYGLLFGNAVRFLRGNFETWDDWEPAIRCMYSGRPIFDPSAVDFRDRNGDPLDLRQAFGPDDDPAELSHFLRTTGFLVVRRAFETALIERLSNELDRILASATEGNLYSWWATGAEGERFPYRLTYLSEQSDEIGALYDHPRTRSLVALSQEEVVPVPDRIEGILAVVKNAGLAADASGYANLEYHTDCGFGACHVTCPCVLVGVQVDGAGPNSSQLHVMAGSWGKAYHNVPARISAETHPIVPIETSSGDATVHFGCGLHAGPPPTGSGRRRTLYLQHYSPRAKTLIGPHQGYNQIMPGYGEGAVPSIDEMRERVE